MNGDNSFPVCLLACQQNNFELKKLEMYFNGIFRKMLVTGQGVDHSILVTFWIRIDYTPCQTYSLIRIWEKGLIPHYIKARTSLISFLCSFGTLQTLKRPLS